MRKSNTLLLESAVRLLQPVLEDLVFVGGCITELLLSDPAAATVRPTIDVDAITEVTTYAQYADLSERLRALGLREDDREGAPTCRWRTASITLDVMPTDETILGFSNPWYSPAIMTAQRMELAGLHVRVISPVYFLATKLVAFDTRGNQDYYGSHDLEDVITVIDGRPEMVAEVRDAEANVRSYIRTEFRRLLNTRDLLESRLGRPVELVTVEALSPFVGPRILAEAQDVLRAA